MRPRHNIITHIDAIKDLIVKLGLWKSNLMNESTRNFPRLSGILDNARHIDDGSKGHIQNTWLSRGNSASTSQSST